MAKRTNHPVLRLAALLLCAGMLSACGVSGLQERLAALGREDAPSAANSRAADGLGDDTGVVHGDTAFADMSYEHYDMAAFTACTDAVEAFADTTGDVEQSAFDAADDALLQELQYVGALYTLADLAYMQDGSDSAAAAEEQYMGDILYQANDAYWDAMRTVAVSDNAILLRSHYSAHQVIMFQQYDDSSYDEMTGLYTQESTLEQEYYDLIDDAAPDYGRIRELFAELVSVRRQIAEKSGYDNAAEYYYKDYYVRDWTPEDAEQLWETAKNDFVPLYDAHAGDVYNAMDGLTGDTMDCSPESILAAMESTAPQISPTLDKSLSYMEEYGLYDIKQSDSKVDTGFTTYLFYYNEPFLFNSPANDPYDYTNTFHEFGHFTSMYLHGEDLVFGVQDNDLAELQSQGMEVSFLPYYEEIFGKKNASAMRDNVVLSLLNSVIEGALFDEFQQRVYAEEHLTGDRAQEIFDEVCEEYGYDEYQDIDNYWMEVSHNFDSPFYYISYAASALPALEIYTMQRDDRDAAENLYLKVEKMDPEEYYFTEAVQEAGLSDVFDAETGRRIAKKVNRMFAY